VQVPGLANVWVPPIRNRIDMLATGIKSPVGIKVAGASITEIDQLTQEIERVVKRVPGVSSALAERLAGGRFIDIDIRDYDVPATVKKRLQFAYRIDTSAVNPLSNLPASVASDPPPSLPQRNLLRGWRLGLGGYGRRGILGDIVRCFFGNRWIEAQQGQRRHRRFVLLSEHGFRRRAPRRDAGELFMGCAQQRGRAKPEDQNRHRQDDRREQKPKTGEHGRQFRLAQRGCRAVDAEGNAVTTQETRILTANQADSRVSQRLEAVCYKMGGGTRRLADERRF